MEFMVPELKKERNLSELDTPELTSWLDGGVEATDKRREIYDLLKNDPVFIRGDEYYLSRQEAFDRVVEISLHAVDIAKEKNLDSAERYILQSGNLALVLPLSLHSGVFIPAIRGQGDEEQQKKWLPLAASYQIFGAYAQTELGHGSNVRGLETTATYDEKAQEFIVNTPTLTATKFWPGALGHIATHAVVMARLVTKGVDRGIHPFIVQIRSLRDHTPLPGISVGDIGPKMGYFGMDNGFLALDHVRIPRDHMLMKYSQVMPDGTYVKPPRDKMAYITMVASRFGIANVIVKQLQKAITIAIRYSAVRKQGRVDDSGPEVQVLDYQTQQLQLFPLLAASYVLDLGGRVHRRQFYNVQAEIEKGNFEPMQEIHASTCGLKAFSTDLCTKGIEVCRQACGGHGYSRACGIPDIYLNQIPSVTYEGNNTILYLQTARYLSKVLSYKASSKSLPENISYLGQDFRLSQCPVRSAARLTAPAVQLEIYEQRARRMVDIAVCNYQQGVEAGLSQVEAWQQSTCDWVVAAKAHCHYVALKSFIEVVQSSDLSPSNLEAVNALCSVFATHGIVTRAGEFMTGGYMSSDQVSMCREQLYSLLKMVRREAVALVDAFDIPDHVLNSVLGRYDGDVYTHLLDWAKKAPRNKKPVHDVYQKHLKKFLKSKL